MYPFSHSKCLATVRWHAQPLLSLIFDSAPHLDIFSIKFHRTLTKPLGDMSFGYSVGDVIAGANLTCRLIGIMRETKGASVEYLEAMSELSAMQQAFIQIREIRSHGMLPAATVNAASHIALSSMETIAKFLERTKHYQRQLEDPRAPTFQNSWYKVGWTLYKSHELRDLRVALHSRLTSVQVLLSAASHCMPLPATVAQYQVDGQNSPALSTLEPSLPLSPPGDRSAYSRDADTIQNNSHRSHSSSPTPEQDGPMAETKGASVEYLEAMSELSATQQAFVQEHAQKQIEKAKIEAETATRERIAAERKAEEERVRKHAEAMRQAEEKGRSRSKSKIRGRDEGR
ncbi:hypothetical protein BKA56DRAFT_589775 [Ilyonectria sp. MPI-CAGE-AT-0026]|nr:hypothetical protein BKA56DRAFT_589775 [Ilyonectria sp. MPI-CAGE-AT-0026]